MTLVTCDMAVSVDGFAAGPGQTADLPFGEGPVDEITRWMLEAREENAAEVAAIVGADAYVMGRNMFGPGRGAWDLGWTGWWGPAPPYGGPVFVVTHHEREALVMEGGTTFHFVTGGFDEAMARAVEAAGPDGRVDVAGGASTANQALAAGVVDELRLHVAPVVLGRGERLFTGIGPRVLRKTSSRDTSLVTHVTYRFD